MGRYTREFWTGESPQKTFEILSQYLQSEGYEYMQYGQEDVFKKGNGFITGPTFFKFSFTGGVVRMETWVKYVLFPGVFIGELPPKGGRSWAAWRDRIQWIEGMLSRNQGVRGAAAPVPPYNPTAQQQEYNDGTQVLPSIRPLSGARREADAKEGVAVCANCAREIPASATRCEFCGQSRSRQTITPQTWTNPSDRTAGHSGANQHASTELKGAQEANRAPEIVAREQGFVFCTKCGARILATAAVCTACGANRSAPPQFRAPQANQAVHYPPATFRYDYNLPRPAPGERVSFKDYVNKYAAPNVRNEIKTLAIVCYILAGMNFIYSSVWVFNIYGLIAAALFVVFGVGIHVVRSRICAILLLLLGCADFVLSIMYGVSPATFWIILGIAAVVLFSKFTKSYKQFLRENNIAA